MPLILVEATGFAIGQPGPVHDRRARAARPGGRPRRRASFGASGTLGFVIASLVAGAAAEIDIRLPFYVFAVVMTGLSLAAFAVAWPRLRERSAAMAATAAAAGRSERRTLRRELSSG